MKSVCYEWARNPYYVALHTPGITIQLSVSSFCLASQNLTMCMHSSALDYRTSQLRCKLPGALFAYLPLQYLFHKFHMLQQSIILVFYYLLSAVTPLFAWNLLCLMTRGYTQTKLKNMGNHLIFSPSVKDNSFV